MKYKRLGNTGLKVSSLCLGTMTFGDGADEAMSQKIYHLSRDKGINFFDCANVYAGGNSERILGKLIQQHRDQVIVATKAYFPTAKGVNNRGSSRFHLTKALEGSLKRLNTSYIDLYYLHSFDTESPLEESLSTLNDFVRQGKVLYIGLSNFAAWQVMKALAISKQYNYNSIACIQPMYNLLKRQCESEILPMAKSEGLGVVSYSPLAGGLLTGKYLNSSDAQGSRYKRTDNMGRMYQKRYENDTYKEALKKFIQFTKEQSFNPIQLAIAWVGAHDTVTSPIVGARHIDHLKPALAALEEHISSELYTEIADFFPSPVIATDRTEEQAVGWQT